MDSSDHSFDILYQEIKTACYLEGLPQAGTILSLAKTCGPAEIQNLIGELDSLDDTNLVDDAGDLADEYWRLRSSIVSVLAAVGECAVDQLLAALRSQNARTRGCAAAALGRIGNRRAFEPIMALLGSSANEGIELELIAALGNLRDNRAIGILLPYLAESDALRRGWLIRITAVALGTIGDESVIAPLARVLETDRDWFARVGADSRVREVASKGLAQSRTMKLEVLFDDTNYDPVIALHGFQPAEAQHLFMALQRLGNREALSVELHEMPWVTSQDGCRLTLTVCEWDQGIMQRAPGEFQCGLTPETWDNLAGLVEPFTVGGEGYQWLASGEARLVLSVDGRW
jgi:hypothetical protein